MSVTHTATVRTSIADHVVDKIDVSGPGTIELQTSANAEVATLTFSNPAFGAASAGVATASAITADSSATGGTVAKAVIKDGAGTEVCRCSVTATGGGGDIELNSVVISAAQNVSLSALTYEATP